MTGILDCFAPPEAAFNPRTVGQYVGLQLALKRNELGRIAEYAALAEHSLDRAIREFSRQSLSTESASS